MSLSFTPEGGRFVVGEFVEVGQDSDSTGPLAGLTRDSRSGRDDSGDDLTGAGDLHLFGFTGFNGGDQAGKIGLGVVHVHPHLARLANLARKGNPPTSLERGLTTTG